jgi:hypothetical protein
MNPEARTHHAASSRLRLSGQYKNLDDAWANRFDCVWEVDGCLLLKIEGIREEDTEG